MAAPAPARRGLLTRIDDGIGMFEALIVGGTMVVMAINTIANVFGRYVFGQSIYFTEEVNEILMVMVTFVGLGYVTRKGRHVRMSALYDLVPERARKILMTVIALTTGAAMFLLAWYAFEYVQKVAQRGRVTPALLVPLWMTYVWVVIGFAAAGLQYLLTAFKNANLTEPGVFVSYSETDAYEDPELAAIMELYSRDHPGPDAAPTP